MTVTEKRIIIALTLSAMLVIFNIIAVTQGDATDYYGQIKQFVSSLL